MHLILTFFILLLILRLFHSRKKQDSTNHEHTELEDDYDQMPELEEDSTTDYMAEQEKDFCESRFDTDPAGWIVHSHNLKSGPSWKRNKRRRNMREIIQEKCKEIATSHNYKSLKLNQVAHFAGMLAVAWTELWKKNCVTGHRYLLRLRSIRRAEENIEKLRQQICLGLEKIEINLLLINSGEKRIKEWREQISDLNLEKQNLNEEGSEYKLLQQRFKLSQAYRKMVERGDPSVKELEKIDDESMDIASAQEKMDSLW